MTRALALLVLWVLQAALVVLLVNAEWVGEQTRLERASVAQQFGLSRYAQLETRAIAIYAEWIIDTGIQAQSYARLLPIRIAISKLTRSKGCSGCTRQEF